MMFNLLHNLYQAGWTMLEANLGAVQSQARIARCIVPGDAGAELPSGEEPQPLALGAQ